MGLTVFPFCRRFFRCGYISPGAGRRRLFFKDIMEISLVHNVGEITPRTGQAAVRGGAPMAYRAVADAEHAADQGSPGGKAGGIRAVILVKADALRADLVHVGGGIPVVAVAAHMVRPQGVDVDKQNAHKTIPFSFPACSSRRGGPESITESPVPASEKSCFLDCTIPSAETQSPQAEEIPFSARSVKGTGALTRFAWARSCQCPRPPDNLPGPKTGVFSCLTDGNCFAVKNTAICRDFTQ